MRYSGLVLCIFLLFLVSLSLVFAAPAKIQGSLVDGVELSTLHAGGAGLSIVLQDAKFRSDISGESLVELIASGFSSPSLPTLRQHIQSSLTTGYVTVASAGKQLKLRLGPMPNISISEDSVFSFEVPSQFVEGSDEPIYFKSTIYVGTMAYVSLLTDSPVVGSPVSVRFSGVSASKVSVVQGVTCRGDDAKISHVLIPDDDTLQFTPLKGGTLSFCLQDGENQFQIKGLVTVSGAEGISTEPLLPRSTKQFFINVFGTQLTEQDSVALSTTKCTAKDVPNFELFDFEFMSSSRGGFFATVPEAGVYNVCYQRLGGDSFINIGTITVEKGGDSVIDGHAASVVVEHDTLVLRNSHITRLTVISGTLILDHFHLNVTHFEWLGGSIYGPGIISIMGDKSVISNTQPIVIDFSLRNLGHLQIRLGSLSLAGTGTIINYHRLVIDATGADIGQNAKLLSHHDQNVIRNMVSGSLSFRGMSSSTIEFQHTLFNLGELNMMEGAVLFTNLINSRSSLIEIAPTASLAIVSGVIQGEVHLGVSASLTLASSNSIEISGALFSLSESSSMRVTRGSVILSSSRFEGNGVISFGWDDTLSLTLEGASVFSFGLTVGFRKSSLASPRGCILIFYGNVALNLENTFVGDNVVIQSRLTAIVFAKGQDVTRLIPQNLPHNTSLVIPANTTLVIVDTENRTQEELLAMSATPVVCSYYVVVPMYVAVEGDILLRGCAMLPYGGIVNGMVSGSSLDTLDASIKTAFCKTALLGGDGCIAASTSTVRSGLVLRGDFTVSSKSSARFDVDFLRISNGSLAVSKELVLHSPMVQIDADAALLLESGGLLTVESFILRGLLHTDGGVVIQGKLDARGGLLKLPPGAGCNFPIIVNGEALYEGGQVQCTAPSLTPLTGALVKSESFVGMPTVDQKTCSASAMVSQLVLDQQSVLSLQISEEAFQISPITKCLWLGLGTTIIAAVLVGSASYTSIRELFGKPPMSIDLLWTEFSVFIPNLLIALGMMVEVVILCAPAFLHSVPNTFILSWFSRTASNVIEPRESSSAPPLSVLSVIGVFVWSLAWLPLLSQIFKQHVHQLVDSSAQRRSIRMLFQFHTAAVILVVPFYIPTLSVLFETVTCNTLYTTAQSCQHMKVLYWPFLAAAVALMFLAPCSGVNKSFPFSHPPYQRDLDIRFKRSYTHIRYALLSLLVFSWKIAGSEKLFLVGSSLVILVILFLVTIASNPCGYRNVNVMVSVSLLYPIWAHLCALFSELHSTQSGVCPDTDYFFIGLLILGWVLISGMLLYTFGKDANLEFSAYPDIADQLHKIIDESHRIEECRSDMYSAINEREREQISHTLSSLKLQHLRHLTVFRHKKEALMLLYYLGEEAVWENYATSSAESTLSEDAAQFAAVTKSAPVEIDNSPLSIDLMDSYVRGPQIGSGSYGAVYMGMLSAGRLVAVKEVRISSKKKDALAQVKKEVDFLRSVTHPNIVQYFGCRNKGGMMYVFMEFATGGSLTSLVKKFGRLQEPVVGMYAQQILTGLSYLHSKGIVHRDIKGDNILIDSCGVAKLADFGCSKLLADMANTGEEGCGTLIGSPYWMAPEVIRSEAYGTKADIWSVGCTVVEMLNGGEPAWREKFETAFAAMYFIGHSTEQCPTNIPGSVSAGCRDFLSKCFERDVAKRADTMELLAHPWIKEAQASPLLPSYNGAPSPASVSMESVAHTMSADASFEREMSSFA